MPPQVALDYTKRADWQSRQRFLSERLNNNDIVGLSQGPGQDGSELQVSAEVRYRQLQLTQELMNQTGGRKPSTLALQLAKYQVGGYVPSIMSNADVPMTES